MCLCSDRLAVLVGVEGRDRRLGAPQRADDLDGDLVVDPADAANSQTRLTFSTGTAAVTAVSSRVVLTLPQYPLLELLRERETRFELALVDTSAPDLELDEHLRELKRQHPDLPIVLSSGYRPRQSMEQDRHVRAFLGKPYRPSQLVETVQRILEEGDRESGTA